jgi:methionyl-tRNA formyltransferase
MKFGWIGFHVEGMFALRSLLEKGFSFEAVVTLKPHLAAKRSGAADYHRLCGEFGIPVYEVANINDEAALELLRKLELDVAFVIGWTQIVSSEALSLVRLGMIGAHASLLPHNRGRAPINWALINGETLTGNSLMWLAPGVDTGDIIDQIEIDISPYDTCDSLYTKVAESNRDMILRTIPKLLSGERPGQPQKQNEEPPLPGRRPEDGLIDWSIESRRLYDFVRALTRPYPGAFSWLGGQRWKIWKCALLLTNGLAGTTPGQVIGPLLSPVESACGQVVACGSGAVALLELESDVGEIVSGRQLSQQPWVGRVWNNG